MEEPVPHEKLYSIPIPQRPKPDLKGHLRRVVVSLFLLVCFVQINALQFCLLPLAVLPGTRGYYADGIRYTKRTFGISIVFISQLFAPTSFRVTYDTSNMAGIDWMIKDPQTGSITLNWPKKVVTIANHQMYADWWYLWSLSYFANMHAYILIVLKKSLKWMPILGWGMQFFEFIFLARSWAADRDVLTSRLSAIAAHHTTTTSARPEDDEPLNFILFPEGNLVSADTAPISKKYAEKMNLVHPRNTLLPRSTGLHTSLIALSQIPSLYLMDVTVGYPGIPMGGFGQTYYTLRSIFMDNVPPPEIVYHVRMFNVQQEVPLRAHSALQKSGMSIQERKAAAQAASKQPELVEVTEEDKKVFDEWLRKIWMEKDAWLEDWLQRGGSGPLTVGDKVQEVVIPVRLKNWQDFLAIFVIFIPLLAVFYNRLIGRV
ncbi:hypothetical protein CPB86DRAFT_720875 [Serendipita vermifera]|nr:hypothetical protein CPB86DRAFT_720875 [Serendipita vermifera]